MCRDAIKEYEKGEKKGRERCSDDHAVKSVSRGLQENVARAERKMGAVRGSSESDSRGCKAILCEGVSKDVACTRQSECFHLGLEA